MKKQYFEPVSAQVSFPSLEEEVLAYWKEHKIFEKSVDSRSADKTWTFLDGPPFITGLPHYGTLLVSVAKDVFPRFFTMRGYRVRRVWGWDVHGLPAENKVETQLGLKSKREIEEKVGVKKFIKECKLYVSKSSKEWEWYIDHIGRWVDFQNAYKTMDLSYMETVMWVFKQMYDKGHIYKGLRVSLYCPHCATPISNFEVAMDADNYKDITEPTAVYKYQLKDDPRTYLLAWSTTPWNKLATPALAINPKLTYVKVSQKSENYILAKSTLQVLQGEYKILEEFKGDTLVGKKFVPHYDFYKLDPGKQAFMVISGDFVTAEEGTGIVTIAAYGEEDLAVMLRDNIQLVLHVNDEGMLNQEVPKWGGLYYLKVNPLVIEDLQSRGLIYRVDNYSHSVPTCWRCHTRLFYSPQNAWFVNIQQLKARMKQNNEPINWFPEHFKYGRFLKSLEAAPDWCISRSRYWGSPVPVWECGCGERFVPGSITELEKASGKQITDLHKPDIDEVTVVCKKCAKMVHRVPEVLDSWIEAGSAPYAERHFPFNKDIRLEDFFPTDFIVEYTGQIRAWFYVLHVISTALYDSHEFKNVLVTGVILGTDGRKMSKNLGNYPDPKELLQKYGGDALRLYFMSSPLMHGEDIRISEEQYRNQIRGIILIIWNVYNFFVTYANADGWDRMTVSPAFTPVNVLDRWILSLREQLIADVTKHLGSYDSVETVRSIESFINDLSTWYIRRSRDRVGPTTDDTQDKQNCHLTMYLVLTTLMKLMAPLVPFLAEKIYRGLTGEESVHLTDWPISVKSSSDNQLEEMMESAMKLASVIHAFRKENNLKVRVPLKTLSYSGPDELTKEVYKVVLEEVNVYDLVYQGKSGEFVVSGDSSIENQDVPMGQARELVRQIQMLRKEKGCTIDEHISVELPEAYKKLSSELLDLVKRRTLTDTLVWGKSLALSTGSTF